MSALTIILVKKEIKTDFEFLKCSNNTFISNVVAEFIYNKKEGRVLISTIQYRTSDIIKIYSLSSIKIKEIHIMSLINFHSILYSSNKVEILTTSNEKICVYDYHTTVWSKLFLLPMDFWEEIECYKSLVHKKKLYVTSNESLFIFDWETCKLVYVYEYTDEENSEILIDFYEICL